jgi:hypothetical protein
MLSPARHLVQQRSMIASLGGVALDSLRGRFRSTARALPTLPGPELSVVVPAPSDALVDDFLRYIAADGAGFAQRLPSQLFPQWGLPVALRVLRGSGLPLTRLLNGGCRLEQRAPLLRGRDLLVRARLSSISSDERRSVICQRIVNEQAGAPEALVADVYGIIRGAGSRGVPKQREPIPSGARKLEDWRLESDAGLRFALLTGDFNPLHWLGPYARALGFGGKLLHGFATMARAQAALERAVAPRRLRMLDVRFVRPLTLPARVALYLAENRVFVGAAGEPPYLTGTFDCD